uniref:Slc30a-5 n=1 Tax=Schmidtea mediterranea TaxID=79327 RepID=A0A0H3YF81_SCHMD|nr:slc30a-5 [Schmidtea mediterranea]
MVHRNSHTLKYGSMIVLVLLYFLVELIVGHMLNSITLIADSFHMLSDFIALIIGIAARRIGKWPKSSKNTFGWQRAEVVGSLVNTVMLTTLTFTILIKSIQRFIQPEEIEKPHIIFYVGLGGLLVNIIGLIILRNHHGHSHGPETAILLKEEEEELVDDDIPESPVPNLVDGDVKIVIKDNEGENHGHSQKKGASHMNMRAVYLHVLADLFGSIAVVISAIVLWQVPNFQNPPKTDYWKLMVDPLISVLMVVLILISTVPLLKQSALILLQSVPKDVSIKELKDRMENIEGIEKVHDLHVWLLQSDVIIGTVHIRCSNENYVTASKKVKKLFHEFRIHCTTIQAEFDEHANDSNSNNSESKDCVLYCESESTKGSNNICAAKQSCCPTKTVTNNNKALEPQQPIAFLHQESAPSILTLEHSQNSSNAAADTTTAQPRQTNPGDIEM